jgi:hypothetical protein
MASDQTSSEEARTAPSESIPALLLSASGEVLSALIENPSLDETQVCLLLERKDLPATLLDEIAKRKKWRASYRVRCALASHPRTPRLTAMRMLRDLHLMDLVRISLLTTSSGELRRLAEERVLTQLPQLPLGQKLMLARRGPGRVAGELIVCGPEQVTRIALDNTFLTESHVLKSLAKASLPARAVATIAGHKKWSNLVNVRVALLRNPHSPPDLVLAFLPDLPRRDIEDLLGLSHLPAGARDHLRGELARRDEL